MRQVVLHVDRHMQMVSADVEERLRMYEATIIRVGRGGAGRGKARALSLAC